MKPEDLRKGNYVRVKETALHYTKGKSEIFKISEIRKNTVFFKGFHAGEYYKDLEPIPITKDLLLRFGFDDIDYKKGYIGIDYKSGMQRTDFVITKPKVMGEWQDVYVFDLRQHRFIPLKHINDLQNLFYLTTKTELHATSINKPLNTAN